MKTNVNLSIILPCYNEEKNISFIVDEFLELKFFDQCLVELILVDNGSEDGTEEKIEEIINNTKYKTHHSIIKKKSEKNLGYGGGIKLGIENAKGDYIAWAHADLQTPLEDIRTLFNKMNGNINSFGKGVRVNNRGLDAFVSKIHEKLASIILGFNMKEINAQPKIFHRSLLKIYNDLPIKWTVIDTYVYYHALKNKIRIYETEVSFNKRLYGESKWKNNYKNFLMHLIFNFLYLFELKFKNN